MCYLSSEVFCDSWCSNIPEPVRAGSDILFSITILAAGILSTTQFAFLPFSVQYALIGTGATYLTLSLIIIAAAVKSQNEE